MFIKICGMTRKKDVEYAKELGVDAVGFIFAESPRKLLPAQAAELAKSAGDVLKVGVFVNADIDKVRRIREHCQLDIIQLHGDETPEYCAELGGKIVKAFRLKSQATMLQCDEYPQKVVLLLDAWSPSAPGGTGKQIEATLLGKIKDFSRIIIAGGLGVDNIAEIVKKYQPFGLDINSGVEKSPGIKDHRLMKEAVERIRSGNG